ncbi:alpha-L-arabinofuranosidase B [Auriculariales sp. MPI-PUGE-AT-0066]|nr:alpha-L-arabinofuranosidase B [Auriculariales sp. MPI-PUGE-AT-0066]
MAMRESFNKCSLKEPARRSGHNLFPVLTYFVPFMTRLFHLVSTLVLATCIVNAKYIHKQPRIPTLWSDKVPFDGVPLPDYPRPQLVRKDWQNLNGQWEWAPTDQITNPPTGKTLNETVLVPYPIESALSGIQRWSRRSFYRRTFEIPPVWAGKNIQLNFGGINWKSRVWVNGKDAFSFDITKFLKDGQNELIVGVYSPNNEANYPIGKMRNNPYMLYYRASSGIWQTVWIEPTKPAHITQLDTIPDVPSGVLTLGVHTAGAKDDTVTAIISTKGKMVATATGKVGKDLKISIAGARLWSPDDPFLYDLKVTLASGDAVTGYFGMRTISKTVVNGFLRPALNGRFLFTAGCLDQGFWPDGLYTAPTDEALRWDLEQQKKLGFNLVRKHIKVEPARWYYHADKLGLVVIQDMPSMRSDEKPKANADEKKNFEDELHRMINQLRGITSIIQWVPFNEGWQEFDETRITNLTKSWDSTRLINGNSGSNCCGRDPGNGDIIDDHIYVGPGLTNLPSSTRIAQLGEYGGIGMHVKGHEWNPNATFGYEYVKDPVSLTKRYVSAASALKGLIWKRGLSASVYTEPTDVEIELNGLYTYDRQVFKPSSFDQLKAINLAVRNSVAWLRAGEYISLGVTTTGYLDRYLRHSNALGATSTVSDTTSRKESTFRVRAGLAESSCWSFEARSKPGYFLRHFNSRVRIDKSEDSARFKGDATFCLRTGKTAKGVSFEAHSVPGHFLRHANSSVYIAKKGGSNLFDASFSWEADTTWQVASPWWRSGADLKIGSRVSLAATTKGIKNMFLRHKDSVGVTSTITSSSDTTTKQDATFTMRAGLADPSCYSFESVNRAGQFLANVDFRIKLAEKKSGDAFAMDATFCARPGESGTGVTLSSYGKAGHAIRHYNSEVWDAMNGGPNKQDNAFSFAADISWRVATPWAA